MSVAAKLCVLSVVLAGFAWGSPAAADVFSPGLIPPASSDYLSCSVVNVDKKAIVVTFQVIDAGGNVVGTWDPETLQPGQASSVNYAGDSVLEYCAFRGVSAKSVRAAAALVSISTATTVLSVPAQ